jgi:hypothetical protein
MTLRGIVLKNALTGLSLTIEEADDINEINQLIINNTKITKNSKKLKATKTTLLQSAKNTTQQQVSQTVSQPVIIIPLTPDEFEMVKIFRRNRHKFTKVNVAMKNILKISNANPNIFLNQILTKLHQYDASFNIVAKSGSKPGILYKLELDNKKLTLLETILSESNYKNYKGYHKYTANDASTYIDPLEQIVINVVPNSVSINDVCKNIGRISNGYLHKRINAIIVKNNLILKPNKSNSNTTLDPINNENYFSKLPKTN